MELSSHGVAAVQATADMVGRASRLQPADEVVVDKRRERNLALDYIQEATAALDPTHRAVFWSADPRDYSTSSGRSVLHFHQHVDGVPVFEAMRTAIFDCRGRLCEVHGDHVSLGARPELHPVLQATDAVLRVALHLEEAIQKAGHRVTRYPPRVLSSPNLPARPTTIHKLPFEDPVMAHLILFEGDASVELSWRVSLSLPGAAGCWDSIVAARGHLAGEILWCRDNVSSARPALGNVWLHDPGDDAQLDLAMPPSLDELPLLRPPDPLPGEFPPPWVADRRTSGNNAIVSPFGGKTLEGSLAQGLVRFRADGATGSDQRILNAFYHCNYIHDLLYLLGFDEARGNFQKVNLTGAPGGNDRLDVSIESQVPGAARFQAKKDGLQPLLALGRTEARRHTALSADIVFHECVHGLTDRLVAGDNAPHPMQQSFQSRALDEGLCDWFALTIQNYWRLRENPPRPEHLVFGAWASGDQPTGLRLRSYENYPFGFGDLADPVFAAEHDAGQVWCAALLSMNRRFGAALGDPARGHELGWQAVVDALKEMSKTPFSITYLTCRDRILAALQALAQDTPSRADGNPLLAPSEAERVLTEANEAFRDFGIGPLARGADPGFLDVVPDP